ncbi:zinc finger protein ZFP2-like [Ochlerotatus camptorhynchus]|uniref:zinc finger protein ZFP2-like n=1 Tax=Ochlerotatus camptorhynchus TaxID=644619 RepID=UPI0031D6AFBE
MSASILFSNVCRVCLSVVEKNRSFPVDAIGEASGNTYRHFLNGWFPESKQNFEEFLPQRICRTCQRKVDDILQFHAETETNMQLLVALSEAKHFGNLTSLKNQLHSEQCRSILHRLNLIKRVDGSEEELMTVLAKSLLLPDCVIDVKKEIEVSEGSFEQPENGCFENEDELELELKFEVGDEQDELFDEPATKKVKEDSSKVKRRPCTIHDCAPVVIGQAVQHAKERHRAYCKICGQVFARHSQALYHVAVHKPKELRLQCEMCSRTFCRYNNLNTHLMESHGQKTANHLCALCEQAFETKTELSKHQKIHMSSPCQFCDRKKAFGSYSMLLAHFRKVHEKQIFKCNQCARCFLGRREHEHHQEKHRDGTFENCEEFALRLWDDIFKCAACEKSFYNETYLKNHSGKEHKVYGIRKAKKKDLDVELEYKFKCSDCDARYRLKPSLRCHIRRDHRNLPVICEHCGASFKSRNEADAHIRYIHTKEFRFLCEFCDKRCNTRSDLAAHRRKHTNERPYKCPYEGCEKEYKTNAALINHNRLVHTMERPYKCSFDSCDKAFVCTQQLKSHTMTHTRRKPYRCWYCELGFNSAYTRRMHCRRCHPGQPTDAKAVKLHDNCEANDVHVTSE